MKINYERLLELNREALTNFNSCPNCNGTYTGDQLSAFFHVSMGVERYLQDELNETHKKFLLQVGVLELTEEDMAREKIVGPFNFSHNGSQED